MSFVIESIPFDVLVTRGYLSYHAPRWTRYSPLVRTGRTWRELTHAYRDQAQDFHELYSDSVRCPTGVLSVSDQPFIRHTRVFFSRSQSLLQRLGQAVVRPGHPDVVRRSVPPRVNLQV